MIGIVWPDCLGRTMWNNGIVALLVFYPHFIRWIRRNRNKPFQQFEIQIPTAALMCMRNSNDEYGYKLFANVNLHRQRNSTIAICHVTLLVSSAPPVAGVISLLGWRKFSLRDYFKSCWIITFASICTNRIFIHPEWQNWIKLLGAAVAS